MTGPLSIGSRRVGVGEPTYVIAELGSNHDGSLDKALEMIDAAATAGADAVKFQSLLYEEIYASAVYDQASAEEFSKIELPETWYPVLAEAALEHGIDWLSSVTYLGAVDLLMEHEAAAIKIASPQFDTFPDLVKRAAETGLPLIMSTGLTNLGGIQDMLHLVDGVGKSSAVLLHCVSSYPATPENVNLSIIPTYRQTFDVPIGYSDHALGIDVAVASVALGATVLEKHFTLNQAAEGPDHHFATEPIEFKRMVTAIRTVEQALGDGKSRPRSAQAESLRQSLLYKWTAHRRVKKGETMTKEALTLRRAPFGIPHDAIGIITQAKAKHDIEPGQPIEWHDLYFASDYE